jgi:hypothetical protein
MVWNDRKTTEEKICEILGSEWITSNIDYVERRENTGSAHDRKKDFEAKGGYVTYKTPLVLNKEEKIQAVQKKIVEIGTNSFIRNIPKLKKYVKDSYK